MKKLCSLYFIIFLGTIFFSSCTVNKPAEPVRTISVSGTGSVAVKPDQVTLRFFVKTSEWNVNLAAEKNATATTNVLKAIKALEIDEADIATYDYRISQDNSKDYPGKYTVTNSITVLVRNIEKTGNVIDEAVKNGANGLTSFEYSVSDTATALGQARTLAVQDAQDAAALLAGASGCILGNVMDIQENGHSSYANTRMLKAVAFDSTTTPIEAGTVTISTSVSITYALQ